MFTETIIHPNKMIVLSHIGDYERSMYAADVRRSGRKVANSCRKTLAAIADKARALQGQRLRKAYIERELSEWLPYGWSVSLGKSMFQNGIWNLYVTWNRFNGIRHTFYFIGGTV